MFWRLVSINISEKERTYDIERKQNTFVEAIHRTLDPFSLDTTLLLFFFSPLFFTDQARWFCARQRIFQRTNVDGRVAAQCRPHVIRVCCTKRVFARHAVRSASRISRDFRFAIIFALAYRYVLQKVLFTLQFKSFYIFSWHLSFVVLFFYEFGIDKCLTHLIFHYNW